MKLPLSSFLPSGLQAAERLCGAVAKTAEMCFERGPSTSRRDACLRRAVALAIVFTPALW